MKTLPTSAYHLHKRVLRAILGLLLVLAATAPARAQWALQPFSFPQPDVFAYRFGVVDANVVWAVGYDEDGVNRSVARTTDGGQTWALRTVPGLVNGEIITSVAASSASSAWLTVANATSTGGYLLRTVDGGQTWAVQSSAQFLASVPNFVHFFSATEGVAVGDPLDGPAPAFEIFTTTDGGATWGRVLNVPPALPNENGVVLAPAVVGNALWFATDANRVFRTTDRGRTWAVAVANTTPCELYTVAFRDAQNGLALSATTSNTLVLNATRDGGQTWQQLSYSGPLHGTGLVGVPGTNLFLSVGEAQSGGAGAGSSYSADGGATWVPIETTLQHAGIAAFGRGAVWSGAVTTTWDGVGVYRLGAAVLGNRPAAAPAAALAYPNPSATGNFHVTLPGAATMRVFDALGREVLRRSAGAGLQLLSLPGQAPGLYTLVLETSAGASRQPLLVR